jgi:hypothetical protein
LTKAFLVLPTLGSLGHQAEAYPQPFKPSTTQTSQVLLPRPPGYDSLHSTDLDSFQLSNVFHPTPTSRGPEPNGHPDSRSSHFDASLLWPSDLDRLHEQQRLKQLDEWLNGSDFLEAIINPSENHQEEQCKPKQVHFIAISFAVEINFAYFGVLLTQP